MTTLSDRCSCSQQLKVLWRHGWGKDDIWHRQFIPSAALCSVDTVSSAISHEADVLIILASANRIRECAGCRKALTTMFHMPSLWWTEYGRKSNGYFGSATTMNDEGSITGLNTWARFLVKMVQSASNYKWYKINVFVRWLSSPQQTIILLFDAPGSLAERIPSPLLDDLSYDDLRDPFWIYMHLVEDVVRLQDETVWENRTHIRNIEKSREPTQNGFSNLHDEARHSIHISETLGLGVKTMTSMLREHAGFMANATVVSKPRSRAAAQSVHERLRYFEHMLESLRHRAMSNKERLNNEMQLTFHKVTQSNAELSLQMNKSMRSDSAAMKTVAFLTLAFLPATFISAVFSMSFFNYDPDTGWAMSSQIWVYWAFAIPVTLITSGTWLYWQSGWLTGRG